ncbi:class I SAM-dependent methyltransferase [Thiocapsa bogorovii]|uniref:class I SAM-dependent methyltransferase n=1 Tax=Thiocapsa bogorovii TaxID=521689 RepID=UPI001E4C867B|nr:class I SAM-dependent methyltransferase [Thiocapsa bogorovii]UHD14705.1 class I SAM-dependent methyltransferase [Thiocapsa bogorovii]
MGTSLRRYFSGLDHSRQGLTALFRLKDECRSMTLVDLTERCIDACRQRFVGDRHISYSVNDGKSLPTVADSSADLVFSFDSLVHVEIDVMSGYIEEIARVLRPEGVAFIHHSNMAAFKRPDGEGFRIENKHWRGRSVSADIIAAFCAASGLCCYRQELVNWGCPDLIDSFSYIARRGSSRDRRREVIENPRFMQERIRLSKEGWKAPFA